MLDLISYGGLYQCIGTLWKRVIHLSCFSPLLTDTACCWNIGSWLSCDKCLYSYSVLSKFVVVWVHCTAHNLLWLCIVLHRFPLWKKLAFIEERSVWYMSSWYVHFLLCILLQNFYIYVLLLYIIYIVKYVVFDYIAASSSLVGVCSCRLAYTADLQIVLSSGFTSNRSPSVYIKYLEKSILALQPFVIWIWIFSYSLRISSFE